MGEAATGKVWLTIKRMVQAVPCASVPTSSEGVEGELASSPPRSWEWETIVSIFIFTFCTCDLASSNVDEASGLGMRENSGIEND